MASAGVFNVLWGAFIWASLLFHLFGAPNVPEVWQGIGTVAGILGVGCLAAATNPVRHWPVVLMGLLTNIAAAIELFQTAPAGRWPWNYSWNIGLIWLVPFALILLKAYRVRPGVVRKISPAVQEMALRSRTNKGLALLEMSKRQPVIMVFLRQFGCPFCRESLSDLSKQRKEIESTGTQIVLIHMAADRQAREVFQFYGLADLPRVSDNNRVIYRAFGLGRGGLLNVFGPAAVWRLAAAAVFERHGLGWVVGDVFQMPGIFVILQGHIVRSFLHRSVADRPNYRRVLQLDIEDGAAEAVAS